MQYIYPLIGTGKERKKTSKRESERTRDRTCCEVVYLLDCRHDIFMKCRTLCLSHTLTCLHTWPWIIIIDTFCLSLLRHEFLMPAVACAESRQGMLHKLNTTPWDVGFPFLPFHSCLTLYLIPSKLHLSWHTRTHPVSHFSKDEWRPRFFSSLVSSQWTDSCGDPTKDFSSFRASVEKGEGSHAWSVSPSTC